MSAPVSAQVAAVLGQRADDSQFLHPLQGQDAVILQQHHRFSRQFGCGLHGLWKEESLLGSRFGGIRVLEEAKAELHPQHAAYGLVHHTLGNLPLSYQFLQVSVVSVGHHIDIHASGQGGCGSLLQVGAISLIDKLFHRIPIGDNKPVEAPAVPQDPGHGIVICRAGHAAYVVERTHERHRSRIHTHFIRIKVHVPECGTRDFGIHIIAAGLRGAIADEMLEAGSYGILRCESGALVSTHGGGTEDSIHVGIFPVTLRHAAPAGIAGDINHG